MKRKAYGWEDTIACERRLEWQYRGAASGGDGDRFRTASTAAADDLREESKTAADWPKPAATVSEGVPTGVTQ